MKIAIVGTGIGGQSAAIFLRRAGLDVDAYEQAPELTAVGTGLRLSPNGPRFLPARPPIASETSAFRATVPIEGTAFTEAAATARLWLGPNKHFVAYPISGGQLMNVLGVVPSTGREKESWSAAGDRNDLAASFAGWHPAVVEMIKNGEGVKQWALRSQAPLQRWTAGPIAVLGDAAHPMLPHLVQGACQAIEDAACLVAVLAEVRTAGEAAAALRRYEPIRQPRASKIQLITQNQGKNYHLRDGPAQRARDERLAAEGIRAQHWIYDHDAAAL